MSTVPITALDLQARKGWRSRKNNLMTVLLALSLVVIAIPLVLVLGAVVLRGGKVMGLHFLRDNIAASEQRLKGGMWPAIVGTVLTTGTATLMAVPVGLLGAIYLHEYGGGSRLARVVRFMTTVMTGVPSVVMGLFIYVIWTLHFGFSGFGGSLALACLMLPIIIRSTEEMLRLVPSYLREASLALGSSKARTVITVVLPAALPGIVSGVLLAVARAAGETAPLLFTINTVKLANWNPLRGSTTALSAQIFTNANSPFAQAQGRGWGAALTLVALAFLFTVIARVVAGRFALGR